MITRPQLPPRKGYVEVVDDGGNHIYQPTKETEETVAMQNDADAISIDHEYRLTLLELGV